MINRSSDLARTKSDNSALQLYLSHAVQVTTRVV